MNLNTVKQICSILNECYPGKFVKTDRTEKIWLTMLRDLEAEIVLAAAYHLASTRPDWPPDLATVRNQAALLAHGELTAQTGSDAWERIREKMSDEQLLLTDLELKALKQVSTIYDLRRSTNPAADRARYIKAYESLVEKQRLARVALPEVRALVGRRAPELPGRPRAPELSAETDGPTPDEARAFMGELTERMGTDG